MSNYDDFLHFRKLSKTRKNWRFPPPPALGTLLLISHLCPDLIQMSEFLYLSCPDVKLWWFSSFSQTFRKIEKIGRFPPPRPWRGFSLISHLCPDFIQMSEFLYLSCPDVKLWWFSSFSQTFRKSEKNWRFPPRRPWGPFSLVSHLCPDFIQMSEFLYLSCPDVKLWWFSSFSQTFRKLEEIEDFPHPRPWGPFSLISHLCPDLIQMSEFLYLSCPDVKLWWFSSFSQTFRKHEKIGRLPPPRPCGAFSLILHLCPDFIQMSEFLYLSCPDVKLWWFSSFSQTFRKIEKIEDLPHPGPGDPFRSFHTSAQISSKLVNFYILVVLMSNYDDFLHFCKLFENSKKLKISPTPALGTLFAHFILVPRFHPNEWIFIS